MGDVIQVLDEITVSRCDRHDGKKHTYELCLVYPEYVDEPNEIVKFKTENMMNEAYMNIIEKIREVMYEKPTWIRE